MGREAKKPGKMTLLLCLNAAIDFSIDEPYIHLSPEMRPEMRMDVGKAPRCGLSFARLPAIEASNVAEIRRR